MKSDKELKEGGPPTHHDNTMRTTFESCRRKSYWFLRGLEFKVTPSYFTWGNAWQRALEVWYTTQGASEHRGAKAIEAAEEFWRDSGSPEQGNDTLDNLKFLITMYAVEYPEEPWDIVTPNQKMELGFELPFEDPYWLCGAIDGYINWPPYGVLLLENKSTGLSLGGDARDKYLAQWTFSTQVDQYLWALRQILETEPFGCLMNVVSKRLTLKAKDALMKTGALPDGQFARNLEKRSEFRSSEFELGVQCYLEDVEREWDRWVWPKTSNPIECVGGIGKSPCPFKRLCLAEVPFSQMEENEILGHDLTWRTHDWQPWRRGRKVSRKEAPDGIENDA